MTLDELITRWNSTITACKSLSNDGDLAMIACRAYLEKLLTVDVFEHNPESLFLCAIFEQARNNESRALELYRRILEIRPNYVNARINLSTILQRLGQADEALQALMDVDLDFCAQLPVKFSRCSSYFNRALAVFRTSVF